MDKLASGCVSACPGLLVSMPPSRPQSYPHGPFPPTDLATPLWKTLLSLNPPQLNRTCLGSETDNPRPTPWGGGSRPSSPFSSGAHCFLRGHVVIVST